MAKTGDAPDRKAKPKPKSRSARPSFTPAPAAAASPAWVYRSDAPVAKPAPAAKPAAAAKPVAAPRRPRAPIAPAAAPAVAQGASRVVHALDVVTFPIAVSLMAVLAPMRRLLGPSRH